MEQNDAKPLHFTWLSAAALPDMLHQVHGSDGNKAFESSLVSECFFYPLFDDFLMTVPCDG